MQCPSYMLMGGQCERLAGHSGKHSAAKRDWSADAPPERYGSVTGVYEWDDESTAREVERQASRFD